METFDNTSSTIQFKEVLPVCVEYSFKGPFLRLPEQGFVSLQHSALQAPVLLASQADRVKARTTHSTSEEIQRTFSLLCTEYSIKNHSSHNHPFITSTFLNQIKVTKQSPAL